MAISTMPRPVRSLILALLEAASQVPRVGAGCYQNCNVCDGQEPSPPAEPVPVLAAPFQQAIDLAVAGHDRNHRLVQEARHGRQAADGDARKGLAEPADVVVARLDD